MFLTNHSDKLNQITKFMSKCQLEAEQYYKSQIDDKVSLEELLIASPSHRALVEYLEWIEFINTIFKKEYIFN